MFSSSQTGYGRHSRLMQQTILNTVNKFDGISYWYCKAFMVTFVQLKISMLWCSKVWRKTRICQFLDVLNIVDLICIRTCIAIPIKPNSRKLVYWTTSGFFEHHFLQRWGLFAVWCDVRGRALASHTGVRRFDSRGRNCLLLFPDYKLRTIYKSWKAQWFAIHFN